MLVAMTDSQKSITYKLGNLYWSADRFKHNLWFFKPIEIFHLRTFFLKVVKKGFFIFAKSSQPDGARNTLLFLHSLYKFFQWITFDFIYFWREESKDLTIEAKEPKIFVFNNVKKTMNLSIFDEKGQYAWISTGVLMRIFKLKQKKTKKNIDVVIQLIRFVCEYFLYLFDEPSERVLTILFKHFKQNLFKWGRYAFKFIKSEAFDIKISRIIMQVHFNAKRKPKSIKAIKKKRKKRFLKMAGLI